jgi:redox-sensing transcriptional repressor
MDRQVGTARDEMTDKTRKTIPEPTLRRLPLYHHFLQDLQASGVRQISCSVIGKELRLDPTQVRKDLEITTVSGKPRIGFVVDELVRGIETTLGWRNVNEAFLAGAGSLGTALLGYERFRELGLEIVAAFESDPAKVGTWSDGKAILAIEALPALARRMGIHIGIITVPAPAAQDVADLMVAGGILAIWNFAPVSLRVPDEVIVQNEELYYSLAALSHKLAQRMNARLETSTGEPTDVERE